MCQCFLSHKIPSSMNVPAEGDGSTTTTTGSSNTTTNQAAAAVFECARKKGVIIKTPTEGPNQQASENDLIVESLVLRELNHPNIVGILGGGKTHTGARYGMARRRLAWIGMAWNGMAWNYMEIHGITWNDI